MSRASSRIKKSRRAQTRRVKTAPPSQQKTKKVSSQKKNASHQTSWLKGYITHLPTFLLCLVSGYLTYLFISNVSPESVRHFLLPNTYLPLIVLVFITIFFLFSFLLLNSRRGMFAANYISLLLFLALNQVIIDWRLVILLLVPFVTIEIILSLIIQSN